MDTKPLVYIAAVIGVSIAAFAVELLLADVLPSGDEARGVIAVIFGLVHFQWGLGGIVATIIMGLVWGVAYLLCGRNLWIVIIAHSTAHLLLVMQLYFTPPPD